MNNRETAIADAKWALSLGKTAFYEHLSQWLPEHPLDDSDDREYRAVLLEIRNKLNTDECLLK